VAFRVWICCGSDWGSLWNEWASAGDLWAMRRWSAQHFRATLQAYFLPASLIGMVGYWLAGLWVPAVTHYYLVCLPVLLPGVWLGRVVNHRLHGDAFLRYVYVGLVGIGVVLLTESVRG